MQRLFNAAEWDVGGVRDDIRAYLMERLDEADGVLVGDDTGFARVKYRIRPSRPISCWSSENIRVDTDRPRTATRSGSYEGQRRRSTTGTCLHQCRSGTSDHNSPRTTGTSYGQAVCRRRPG